MKKHITSGLGITTLVIAFLITSVFTAKAYDCNKSVDIMCDCYHQISQEFKKCQSIEEIDMIDIEKIISENPELEEIPDSCEDYILTSADKKKLQDAYGEIVETIVDVTYVQTGGVLSKSEIREMLGTMEKIHNNILKEATTIGSYIEAINNL